MILYRDMYVSYGNLCIAGREIYPGSEKKGSSRISVKVGG